MQNNISLETSEMALNNCYYFAFGSNLLKERIHLDTECQFKFKCIAKLENWRLTFKKCGDGWRGGSANIFQNEGHCVWGVVWETDNKGMQKLDKQEAVDEGIHERIQVEVKSPEGEKVCTSSFYYIFKIFPTKQIMCHSYRMVDMEDIFCPPSPHYKDVILRGVKQNKLPENYLLKLQDFPDNGFRGKIQTYDALCLTLE